MGLSTHLNDVSSDSVPLLFLAVIINCICYIRSLLFGLFPWFGFSRFKNIGDIDANGLLLNTCLAQQQQQQLNNMNHGHVYSCYDQNKEGHCMVCLSRLIRDEDEQVVHKLACGHVFLKVCLESWLSVDHQKLNSTCPLCWAPLDY